MRGGDLRRVLKQGTAHIHHRLDEAVGSLGGHDSYRIFVQNSYRFRQSVEPALANATVWMTPPLLALLEQDLDDLGADRVKSGQRPVELVNPSAQIGALYVLEGSALGAQLLYRRAQALGYHGRFGARHLARQTQGTGRWGAFLTLMGTLGELDPDLVLSSAQKVFGHALAAFEEASCERI